MKSPLLASILVWPCFGLASADGAVILGNGPHGGFGGGWSFVGNVSGANYQAAVTFTTGDSAYQVESLMLAISEYSVPSHIAQVGFFLDNGAGTNVGAQVGAYLTPPATSNSFPTERNFAVTVPISLAANTKYWLVVDNVGTGRFVWDASSPAKAPTGEGAVFHSTMVSSNNGSSYSTSSMSFTFQISGTAVPEPSATLVGSLAALSLLRRRR